MKFASRFAIFLAFIVSSFAQTAEPNQPPANDPGLPSEWDARKMIDALVAQAQHLKPIVDQVQPGDWESKGASATYVAQLNAAQAQLKYFVSSSEAFSRQPERLPLGLEVYFRMLSVESTLGSLTEGIRKYQNPALASLMQFVIAENSNNRDRLRQYLQDLAMQKDEEFQVADREAQRCRAAMLQQPTTKTKKVAHP